jgi:hypothetical protein
VAKEEKLLDALDQAWGMMAEAVRLVDLALELPAPHRDRVLMTATKVSERILAGLHEAGLDPPRLLRRSEMLARSKRSGKRWEIRYAKAAQKP